MRSVTAAITAYNQERFIGGTIESVLAQSRPADEIVVVDDGSSDDTAGVVRKFGKSVRLIRQANGGVARARNRAVHESSGNMVALLDGDDLWYPTKLERCLATAGASGARVIVHDVENVSADGQHVLGSGAVYNALIRLTGRTDSAFVNCWSALLDSNFIVTTSSVLISRDLYLTSGSSDPALPIASDFDLYLRLATQVEFLLIPEVLTQWRQHDDSASGAGRQRQVNWRSAMADVLRRQSHSANAGSRQILRRAADEKLSLLIRDIYRCEEEVGTWRTARELLRVAVRCHAPRSALVAMAVLTPASARRVAASITGVSLS